MNNSALLRTLLIYALCVPAAIFLGYQLSDPITYSAFGTFGIVLFVLIFPLLIRWHHLLLLLSWNMVAVIFFIKGRPDFWMLMSVISLGISLLHRALNRDVRFIQVSSVTWSLLFFGFVVLVTARMTGGLGLRTFGSEVYGGRRYILLFAGIVGYFALSSVRIPPKRAALYVGAFFLGSITAVISDLYTFIPGAQFLFWIFPPNFYGGADQFEVGVTRISSAGPVSLAVISFILARFGVRGLLTIKRPWRLLLFVAMGCVGMLGGFRSAVILIGGMFFFAFLLEGLHRTKMLPVVLVSGILIAAVALPFASKLPFTFQRALAFLPDQVIELNPAARAEAEASTEWRLTIWKAVLPEIPNYFWLGKGFSLAVSDFDAMGTHIQFREFAESWGAALSGDYHNGPLSVILTFGIWGVIGFLWFLAAGVRVLYRNYRYGSSELKNYNTFLFAWFITKVIYFFVVFGGIQSDLAQFAGVLGLSISLNGGVSRRVPQTVQEPEKAEVAAGVFPTRPVFLH